MSEEAVLPYKGPLFTLAEDLEKNFPGLRWTDSGKAQLQRVIEFLADHPDLQTDTDTRAQIELDLVKRLHYLSGYGGDKFQVRLSKDYGTLCFSLVWFGKDENGEYNNYFCNGGLQFQGCAQPFGSVVIGDVGYWSINT